MPAETDANKDVPDLFPLCSKSPCGIPWVPEGLIVYSFAKSAEATKASDGRCRGFASHSSRKGKNPLAWHPGYVRNREFRTDRGIVLLRFSQTKITCSCNFQVLAKLGLCQNCSQNFSRCSFARARIFLQLCSHARFFSKGSFLQSARCSQSLLLSMLVLAKKNAV